MQSANVLRDEETQSKTYTMMDMVRNLNPSENDIKQFLSQLDEYAVLSIIQDLYSLCHWKVSQLNNSSCFISSGPVSFKIVVKTESLLGYDEVLDQLTSGGACNGNQIIFSVHGYESETKELEDFNTSFYGIPEIIGLAKYASRGTSIPYPELMSHNALALKQIETMLSTTGKACVVQATGTGKSYLIARCVLSRPTETILILAPNFIVLSEVNKVLVSSDNVTYMTYAKCALLPPKYWQQHKPGLIIFDEFHRAGADMWGCGVQKLLHACPNAKKLGTTATHIRHLDDERNMAEELFGIEPVRLLTLNEAIARQILPSPHYVSALYSVDQDYTAFQDRINRSYNSQEEKQEITNDLKSAVIDWRTAFGVSEILYKHLPSSDGKYIVFCESAEHLFQIMKTTSAWFKESLKKKGVEAQVRRFAVYSKRSKSKNAREIKRFADRPNKGISLLFAINMLNEGLHVHGVNGVVLLRKTTSPILYFQQIGRSFSAQSGNNPVIFDLVGNIDSIMAKTLRDGIGCEIEIENKRRRKHGLSEIIYGVEIFDESENFRERLAAIETRIHYKHAPFDVKLRLLQLYSKEYGHMNILCDEYYRGVPIGEWVTRLRKLHRDNGLTEIQIQQLLDGGLDLDPLATQYNSYLSALEKFVAFHGHCNVPYNYEIDGLKLGNWSVGRRVRANQGELTDSQMHDLAILGFVFDKRQDIFEERFVLLQEYFDQHGNIVVPCGFTVNGINLYNYLRGLRDRTLKQSLENGGLPLDEEQLNRLGSLGFDLTPHVTHYKNLLEELRDYKTIHGHCQVPLKEKGVKTILGGKVHRMRDRYRKRKLDDWFLQELKELGYSFDKREEDRRKRLAIFLSFITDFGIDAVHEFTVFKGLKISDMAKVYRKRYRDKNLAEFEKAALIAIKFEFNPVAVFNNRVQERVNFIVKQFAEHGSVSFRRGTKVDGININLWISRITKNDGKPELSSKQVAQLESCGIGFNRVVVSIQKYTWEQWFDELCRFHKENGHSNVPSTCIRNEMKLGKFVQSIRRNKHPRRLTDANVTQLKSLDFDFRTRNV